MPGENTSIQETEPIEVSKRSKSELVSQLESAIRNQPIESIKDEVHEIELQYQAIIEHETHEKESSKTIPDTDNNELESSDAAIDEQASHQIDSRFKELIHIFQDRITKYQQEKKEEERNNLEKKWELVNKLKEIVHHEDTIVSAFNAFHEIKTEWKQIGNVPEKNYHELQAAYGFEMDRFFYTINIFRDLKSLDLKKNLDKKLELIRQMTAMVEEKSIRRIEMLVKAFQEEWEDSGPVPHGEWKQVRNDFSKATRKVYHKINKFYDEIRERSKINLESKQKLVDRVHLIANLEIKNPKKWNDRTSKLIELQKEWKKIGLAGKEDNERIWQAFRNECNLFFENKHNFFEHLKTERTDNRKKKQEIVDKSAEIKLKEHWKDGTQALIKLQNEWKSIGSAERKEEQRLWKAFRSNCDYFFEKKKTYYDTLDDRLEENYKNKLGFLEKLETHKTGKDVEKAIEGLKNLAHEWNELGMVPRDKINELNNRYRSLMDTFYNSLDLGKEEKGIIKYKNRVEILSHAMDPKSAIYREKMNLKDRLSKLNSTIHQYELNIGFFNTSKKSNPLLEQAQNKIDQSKSEAELLTQKINELDKAYNKL